MSKPHPATLTLDSQVHVPPPYAEHGTVETTDFLYGSL